MRYHLLVALTALVFAAPVVAADDRQVIEGVVDAPVGDVWKAFTTKEGMEAWAVAHADYEWKVGGRLRTHYDPKGQIGDANSIENILLCYDPQRMFAMRIGRPPEKFPFKDAAKKAWFVIYFEPIGEKKTKVSIIGLGYGDDDESKKMREHFDKGNDYTMKKLQKHFSK